MIYVFITLAAVALAFATLGAMSVWVTVLSMALKAMLAVPVVFVLYLLWQRFARRRS